MTSLPYLPCNKSRFIVDLLLLSWAASYVTLSEGLVVRAETIQKNSYSGNNNKDSMASSTLLFQQMLRRNSASMSSSIQMTASSSIGVQNHNNNNSKRKKKKKVAIIGAGAAGLATARVFSRTFGDDTTDDDELDLVVLEKEPQHVGGIWNYVPNSKTKPVYRGLKTNLPKEIMAYREKPWISATDDDDDDVSFVTHDQVLSYLQEYTTDYNLQSYISHGCEVTQLSILPQPSSSTNADDGQEETITKIQLDWTQTIITPMDNNSEEGKCTKESRKESGIFDVVCICNGHYAAPSTPNIPGLDKFPGKIIHSIEYDDPSDFHGKTVLCVGGRASGADLAREISFHAKQVYLSDTTCPSTSTIPSSPHLHNDDINSNDDDTNNNVIWVPKTMSITYNDKNNDATIHFEGGATIPLTDGYDDGFVILLCSGYDYQFPFINEKSNLSFQDDHNNIHHMQVTPGERRVMPLYEQLWHPKYTNLAFVGLSHSVVPFPFFELQAEAIVAQLQPSSFTNNNDKESIRIPPYQQRLQQAIQDANSGGPKPNSNRVQDTHFLGDYQWDAFRNYSKLAGNYDHEMENYIATNKAIYDHAGKQRKATAVGGYDKYRYNRYFRNDSEKSFEVILADDVLCSETVTK